MMSKNSLMLAPFAMLCVVLALLAPRPAAAMPIVAGVSFTATNLGFTDSFSRMIGWQFTVGPVSIEVTELGFQDFGLDGLLSSHQVGIWRLSDSVLIDSAVVPSGTAGTLHGHFRYAALASPSTLVSGTTYLISGFDTGIDPHVWDVDIGGANANKQVTGFSVDAAITIGAPGTAHGPFMASFGFPGSTTVPDARAALMGPNLRFSLVPEPGSFALTAFGILLLWGSSKPRG